MSDEQQYHDPDEVGRWNGDTFVLHSPLEIAGSVVNKIILSPGVKFGDGVTRDDVVHAMLNPVARVPVDE